MSIDATASAEPSSASAIYDAGSAQDLGMVMYTSAAFLMLLASIGTACAQPTPTPNTPTLPACPQATPEPFHVDPIISPTYELSQVINVSIGNGQRVTITTASGTFTDTEPPFSLNVTLLPDTTNHLEVVAWVKTIRHGDCTYGGYFLREQLEIQQGIAYYDEAVRLNPEHFGAHYNRGNAYGNLGQPERAIQDYDEAIRLNPEHADAYHNRGVEYGNLGQYQRAIEDFDETIRLDPRNAVAHYNRGILHGNLGQPERAIQDYDEAIRLNPNDPDDYGLRAIAHVSLGREAEAQEDVERAVSLGADRAHLETELEEARPAR